MPAAESEPDGEAKRSHAFGRKCRAEFATVLCALLDPVRATLTLANGDVKTVEDWRRTLTETGSDAVISTLGPALRRGAKGTPVADGTRTVIAAMHQAGSAIDHWATAMYSSSAGSSPDATPSAGCTG